MQYGVAVEANNADVLTPESASLHHPLNRRHMAPRQLLDHRSGLREAHWISAEKRTQTILEIKRIRNRHRLAEGEHRIAVCLDNGGVDPVDASTAYYCLTGSTQLGAFISSLVLAPLSVRQRARVATDPQLLMAAVALAAQSAARAVVSDARAGRSPSHGDEP